MRLIDADALKAEFPEDIGGRELWHFTGIWAVIGAAPTIDAEPVKHAEWVCDNLDDVYFCTSCGHSETYRLSAYCPDCGAKMSRPWLEKEDGI